MKTKEKGENIYKMMNSWVRYPYHYEKGNKGYAWRTVEQFLIVSLYPQLHRLEHSFFIALKVISQNVCDYQ